MKSILAALAFSLALTAAESKPVLDAIYANDVPRLKQLIKDPESANAKDPRDTTALMYACAFGSREAVQFLLDSGADVQAANGLGGTALMWATTDPAKLKLLLAHHADVNAKSKSGRTALLVAASQPGADAAVDLLLAAGADVAAADKEGNTFIGSASSWGNSRQVALALARGAKPDTVDAGGFTPLMNAAAFGDLTSVKLLLAKGADVNAVSSDKAGKVLHGPILLGRLTALLLASPYGPAPLVAELLKAGAKANVQDMRGMTPLTAATATERRDPEIIRLLQQAGAKPTAETDQWLAKFATLESAAAPQPETAATVDRALAILRKTSTGFMVNGGCVACHAQPAATMALRVAMDHGYKVTQSDVQEHLPLAKGFWTSMSDRLLLRQDPPGGPDSLDYNLFLLSSMSYAPDTMTAAMVMNLVAQQMPDGSWHQGGVARAPMEDSDFTRTAMSMRALQLFAWPGRKAELDAGVARARAWLKRSTPGYNEEFAMQLLGLKWVGDPAAEPLSAKLAGMQNSDGGWSQNSRLSSDAYATGQTLYALHEAGMISTDPIYKRGVQFLKSTQQADGSWHIRSRSPKFQPYFESGFPHGQDQWISTMGTAWAAMACAM